jgi:hypothetical protein
MDFNACFCGCIFPKRMLRGWCHPKIKGFQVSESRQKSRLIERIKLDDEGRSERPFMKSERT